MASDSIPAPIPSADVGSDPEDALDIGSAVATGIKWKMITQVVSEGSRVIVSLVLARLLTPAQYGIAGMAMVCVSFASMFSDPALGTALVQRRRITEADRSTVFWTTNAIGAVLMVICIGVSGYVADIFGQHEVQKLFIALSVGVFISGFSVTQMSLLIRDLAYRKIEIREIGSVLLAAACALGVAAAGFGSWAIITNWLVFVVASAVLVWIMCPWRPTLTFSRESLTDLGSFGLRVFGARFMGWGNMNLDNVLVGRYLGASALGAYALAYNIMYIPITRIGLPLATVFSPAYARMQHDPERLLHAWLRGKQLISTLLAPAFVISIVIAPDLVRVAFGEKWHAAVLPVQLLSLAGLAQNLVGLHWSILTALKRGGTLLRVNLIVTAVTIPAFIAGLPFGIVGVAGFYAAARWLLVPVDTFMTCRAISMNYWPALRAGADALPLAAATAAIGYGLERLLIAEHVPAVLRLLAVASVMLASYAGLLRILLPGVYAEITSAIRKQLA